MNKDRLKKLEWVALELVSNFLFEHIQNIEQDFWLINITWIKISSDVSYLDVYVSSFKNSDILCKTLAEYAHDIQRKLNKSLSLRKNPRIRFRYDESWKIAWEVSETIKNLDYKDIN